MPKKIVNKSLDNLEETSKKLLNELEGYKIFAFYGKMGVGKTTLIKSICKLMGVEDIVDSPTFSLVNEYKTTDKRLIYHFDFYRIDNINEVFDLGYEEYFYSDSYCFIEWPEKIEEILPENTAKIYIEEKNESRHISIYLK